MIRREFGKKISSAILATMVFPQWLNEIKKVKKIGLQLYTVRDAMAKDAKGTLQALSKMGYEDIESAGYKSGLYYDMKPKVFKSLLDDLGLDMKSGHCTMGSYYTEWTGTMLKDFESHAADAASIGQEYIVLPYLSDYERKSIDDYKIAAELLNKNGEICKQYGLKMAYHNHDFEFVKLENQIPYDVLLENTEKDLVDFELDLYWIRKGGKDYKNYFENHSGRFSLWHVKDMDAATEPFFTEVGSGIIDFKKIFSCEKKSGMKYFYVEQDVCKNFKPMESVRISCDYMKEMKY